MHGVQGVQDAAPRQLQEGAPALSRSICSWPCRLLAGGPWAGCLGLCLRFLVCAPGMALAGLAEVAAVRSFWPRASGGSRAASAGSAEVPETAFGVLRDLTAPAQPHTDTPAPAAQRHPLSLRGTHASVDGWFQALSAARSE